MDGNYIASISIGQGESPSAYFNYLGDVRKQLKLFSGSPIGADREAAIQSIKIIGSAVFAVMLDYGVTLTAELQSNSTYTIEYSGTINLIYFTSITSISTIIIGYGIQNAIHEQVTLSLPTGLTLSGLYNGSDKMLYANSESKYELVKGSNYYITAIATGNIGYNALIKERFFYQDGTAWTIPVAPITYTVLFYTNGVQATSITVKDASGNYYYPTSLGIYVLPTSVVVGNYTYTIKHDDYKTISESGAITQNFIANYTLRPITADVTVHLDSNAYSGLTVALYQSGEERYSNPTYANGVYSFSDVDDGTYDIYIGGSDTNINITVANNDGSVTVNYYSVTYNANMGSGTMTDNNSPYLSGATVTVLSNEFTAPTGKSFNSYNTAADGSGTTYTAGNTFAISGTVIIYAIWANGSTEGLAFTYQNNSYSVAQGTAVADTIVIPSTYNDGINGEYPVTAIDEEGFTENAMINIVIPDSIQIIGRFALSFCGRLQSVSFPANVASIGTGAIAGDNALTSIIVDASNTQYSVSGLCLINFNKSIIGSCPSSVIPTDSNIANSISSYAFAWTSVTSITIPDSIDSISEYAFMGAELESINIPSSVSSIASTAFMNCLSVTGVTVDANNATYSAVGNCLLSGSGSTVCAGFSTSVIPNDNSIITIGEYAFKEQTGISGALALPDSLQYIMTAAFKATGAFTTLTIPANVTMIGEGAFAEAWNAVTSITVLATTPPTLTTGDDPFLKSVNCPIYVPSASLSAYQADTNWSQYSSRLTAITA